MELEQVRQGVKVRDKYGNRFIIAERYTHPFKGFALRPLAEIIPTYLIHHLDWDASDYDILPREAK